LLTYKGLEERLIRFSKAHRQAAFTFVEAASGFS